MLMAFAFLSFLFSCVFIANSQIISTNTPVPPLQWINLSNLLQGSSRPPPLKDAAIGYDETSRSLIIFGGESENGFPQSQTYLLKLDTLQWLNPTPPDNLARSPPARSAAISGVDFAASSRRGFVIIGGKGGNGTALSDVWEYDFINQFWSEVAISPGGPSPRWGASGGIDVQTPFFQDPASPGLNNTLYLAGGYNGTFINPLSDIWRLNMSGTLSSNLPDSATGSWDHVSIGSLPAKVNEGGTVLSQRIISAGGCKTASSQGNACAEQDSYVIDTSSRSTISPGGCPAPRFGPIVTPNHNSFSSAYSSQVFLLLGTFNQSLWEDDGGSKKGEVAVLDTNTGTWSRILPAGDPDASGKALFPSPREGAIAFSYPMSLVGSSRNQSSDIIVFGGRDASGKYLSEVWLLRTYTGLITSSNSTWSGFGNGQLQTGTDADGSGVHIDYLPKCASMIAVPNITSTTTGTIPLSTTSPTSGPSGSPHSFSSSLDTSVLHKVFSPLSIAILLPLVLIFRFTTPFTSGIFAPSQHTGLVFTGVISSFAAYGIGLASIALSFATLSAKQPSQPPNDLSTAHGIVGLAFFLSLYGLVPLLAVMTWALNYHQARRVDARGGALRENSDSPVDKEKLNPSHGSDGSTPYSIQNNSPPSSPRPRTSSWGPSGMWRRSLEGAMSTDSESVTSAPHQRGFEVVNRPPRSRHLSGNLNMSTPLVDGHLPSRSLGEIDWLLRRRSLNAVGELDYALTQAHNAQFSGVAENHAPAAPASSPPKHIINAKFPGMRHAVVHLLFQVSLLGLCIVSLVALWSQARGFFYAFLVWTVLYYIGLFLCAWYRPTEYSVIVFLLGRFKSKSEGLEPTSAMHTETPIEPVIVGQGPYIHHQPLYRTTYPLVADELSSPPRGTETEEEDTLDDDTRQRMIEEEMERRDVSIVTVPKRKLWITNPS